VVPEQVAGHTDAVPRVPAPGARGPAGPREREAAVTTAEVRLLDFVDVAEARLRRLLAGRPFEVEMVELLAEIARRGLRGPKK